MHTNVKALKIAYIGGGSRNWARTFMNDLALEEELGGEIRLYDIDINAARDNEIIGNALKNLPDAKSKWKYKTAGNLKVALCGADFVVISILPGTFTEMKSDVHLPERLGIYQSVGDTAGPGGIIRALRTVPVFCEFAAAIKEHCPDAWVINYTNPMALCVKTLYHAFPEIKAFGCCHEVFGTQELLAVMARRRFNINNIQRKDIMINVVGINHFTWINKASWTNHDLFPLYKEFAEEFHERGFENDNSNAPDICFTFNNKIKFDLFRKYGWIAAAGDRHLAEFFPHKEYLKNPETVREWGFHLTTVDWRINDLQNKLERSSRLVSGEECMKLKASGEEGILLIKAICGLTRVISNVNLPNTAGQASGLPREAVTETNALFSFDDVRPVSAGKIPDDILQLIKPHAENQDIILSAAINCDKEFVYKAFENDPLCNGIEKRELFQLADDMIACTSDYNQFT